MPEWLIKILLAVYTRIPPSLRPVLKEWFAKIVLRVEALVKRRQIVQGKRIEFLDFEIAHLVPFELLGPGPDEILVQAECSLISPGTERAVLCGLPGARRGFPYVPGYSTAGRVIKKGNAVKWVEIGDLVTGRIKHASYESVAANKVFKVPAGVTAEEACFIELGIIVLQGIRKAAIKPGEHVAVVGQGLIGQLANRLARLLMPASLIAVAPSRNRERLALLPGGADRYLSINEDPACVHALEADVVIEAVGTPQANVTAMHCARKGGRVVLLGSSRGLTRDWDVWNVSQKKHLTVIGAHISDMPEVDASPLRWTYEQEGRLFLELLHEGRLKVADLITWRAKPEECNAVYEVLAEGGRDHVGITFNWVCKER
ncbi:MAG: zinc-binding alcohol dehydrogenase [Nitrospira sp.]|nr:zinc-binding alcohol dehydrogenase [Nitrospira sp.]